MFQGLNSHHADHRNQGANNHLYATAIAQPLVFQTCCVPLLPACNFHLRRVLRTTLPCRAFRKTNAFGRRWQAVPKPSPEAQAREEGARKVWLSDVFATAKSPPISKRRLQKKDWEYAVFMAAIHGLCLLAPATFSWPMVGLFFASYFVTGARTAWSASTASRLSERW